MTRKFTTRQALDLHERYMAGESSVNLAEFAGCHSGTLRSRWKRMGLKVRDNAEANVVQAQRASAEKRAARAKAAHDAVRGREVPEEEMHRRARTRQASPPPMSDGEQAIFDSLAAAGHSLTRELAVGRYNLDIAVDATVAVECFGGLWHSRGRHLARHEGRVRHILDAGFDIVVVWLTKGEPPLARLHEVISDLQFFRGDPSAKRQYRVIWRDADVLSRDADSDDFPCKPSFEVFRNARGRYERSR